MRVLPVPSAHPYVAAVGGGPGVALLEDPAVPGAPPAQWWPPQALDAAWIGAHAADFDVLHVHFGTESRTLGELRAAVAALRRAGRPLAFTVHDIEHPHLVDQDPYREQLELLLVEADAVLTLTEAAAERLRDLGGREATVVPHPQLAPDRWFAAADELRAARPRDGAPVVGLHLRAMRANVRPHPWLGALADAVAAVDGTLRVLVNDPPGGSADARAALSRALQLIEDAGGRATVEVIRRPRPDDDELAAELAALDVSVLPYSHGTHSGWLELCWDLGTRVLSPDVGCIAGQHAEPWALQTFASDDPATIGPGLDRLLAAAPPPPAAERLATRRVLLREVQALHVALYRRLVTRRA